MIDPTNNLFIIDYYQAIPQDLDPVSVTMNVETNRQINPEELQVQRIAFVRYPAEQPPAGFEWINFNNYTLSAAADLQSMMKYVSNHILDYIESHKKHLLLKFSHFRFLYKGKSYHFDHALDIDNFEVSEENSPAVARQDLGFEIDHANRWKNFKSAVDSLIPAVSDVVGSLESVPQGTIQAENQDDLSFLNLSDRSNILITYNPDEQQVRATADVTGVDLSSLDQDLFWKLRFMLQCHIANFAISRNLLIRNGCFHYVSSIYHIVEYSVIGKCGECDQLQICGECGSHTDEKDKCLDCYLNRSDPATILELRESKRIHIEAINIANSQNDEKMLELLGKSLELIIQLIADHDLSNQPNNFSSNCINCSAEIPITSPLKGKGLCDDCSQSNAGNWELFV